MIMRTDAHQFRPARIEWIYAQKQSVRATHMTKPPHRAATKAHGKRKGSRVRFFVLFFFTGHSKKTRKKTEKAEKKTTAKKKVRTMTSPRPIRRSIFFPFLRKEIRLPKTPENARTPGPTAPKNRNYPRRMNRAYKRQEAGKPVHEDVAVVGERLAAEETGVEKVPLRRRQQPARSSSSRSGHADELDLHAGADQTGPRRRRCPAPSKCVRVVPAAGAASAAVGGVHRRRRNGSPGGRRGGSPGGIHLRGLSRPIRSGSAHRACSCLCDGALRGEREGRRCLKRKRQGVEVVFLLSEKVRCGVVW
jgi:hypothetical protein